MDKALWLGENTSSKQKYTKIIRPGILINAWLVQSYILIHHMIFLLFPISAYLCNLLHSAWKG